MAKKQEKKLAWQAVHVTPKLGVVDQGLWPWGKYKDTPFSATPRGYVEFMLQKLSTALAEDPNAWSVPLTEAVLAQLKSLDLEQLHDDRPASTSKHLGEVGQRTVFEGLVLKRKRWFDNAYGGSEMVTFQDPQGNVLLYWGNTFSLDEEGARMSLKATVKKHDVFAGVEQTVISRPNILEA